jgi:hypothetical protein
MDIEEKKWGISNEVVYDDDLMPCVILVNAIKDPVQKDNYIMGKDKYNLGRKERAMEILKDFFKNNQDLKIIEKYKV